MKTHAFTIVTVWNISLLFFFSVIYCNLDENWNVRPTGRYEAGQQVTVTCLKPYHLVLLSNKEITCQDNGKWSSEPDCRVCGKKKLINLIELPVVKFTVVNILHHLQKNTYKSSWDTFLCVFLSCEHINKKKIFLFV